MSEINSNLPIQTPIVSIVVPSFNHEKFIRQTIESIYNQTFTNFELFVFDDGSTDKSSEILVELQKKYCFYLEIQNNIGLSNTLTKGFRDFSKGKYLTFCASDDYWASNKLELQVGFLEKNPEYAMVYGKAYSVDESNNILEKETTGRNKNLKGGNIFNNLMRREFHPPVNYMFRAEIIREVGYYNADVWAEDFDMNLRISQKYPIGFINEFIMFYRREKNGKQKMLTYKTTNSHRNTIDLFKNDRLYNQALNEWRFRNFVWYYTYKESKLFAIKNMLLCKNITRRKGFLKMVIKLVFLWK